VEGHADELMLNSMILDHRARLRAFDIVADAWKENLLAQTACGDGSVRVKISLENLNVKYLHD
jgi:hypothetical protein